jgi:hypothetical protein
MEEQNVAMNVNNRRDVIIPRTLLVFCCTQLYFVLLKQLQRFCMYTFKTFYDLLDLKSNIRCLKKFFGNQPTDLTKQLIKIVSLHRNP